MLTQIQYNNLWTINLGLPIQSIPSYYQYLQREVYFQDYLDLFGYPNKGQKTFSREKIKIGNVEYNIVKIDWLQPDPIGAYTIPDSNGIHRLIVDYDFPYPNELLCKDRKIKYILIGEAAPPPSLPRIVEDYDKENSYFYNVRQKETLYLAQPLSAFGIAGVDKTNKLINLAENGIVLLDISPFAIGYSVETRKIISQKLTCDLNNRIKKITNGNDGWDFCLVAPETTSIGVFKWLDEHNECALNGKPTSHPNDLVDIGPSFEIKSKNGKSYNKENYTVNNNSNKWFIDHLTKRAKFTVAIGGTGPNAQLIKRAFNLP